MKLVRPLIFEGILNIFVDIILQISTACISGMKSLKKLLLLLTFQEMVGKEWWVIDIYRAKKKPNAEIYLRSCSWYKPKLCISNLLNLILYVVIICSFCVMYVCN